MRLCGLTALLCELLRPPEASRDGGDSPDCPSTTPSTPECRRTRQVPQETEASGSWSPPHCCSLWAPTAQAEILGGSNPPSDPEWAQLTQSRAASCQDLKRRHWPCPPLQEQPLTLPVNIQGYQWQRCTQHHPRVSCLESEELHRGLEQRGRLGRGRWAPAERKCFGRSEFPRCSEGWGRFYRWSWSVEKCLLWWERTVRRWTLCWKDRCCL